MRRFFLLRLYLKRLLRNNLSGRLFLSGFALAVCHIPTALANSNYIDINDLSAKVQAFVEQQMQPAYPHLKLGETLLVVPGNLDSRLRLGACDSPLTFKLNTSGHGNANLTVKTSCQGGPRWSIYVPVKIETYEAVLTVNKNIARGELISEEDLTPINMNTASLGNGYVRDAARLVGLEAKRQLRSGEVVKLNQLKQPDLISKGDTVVLRARTRVLSVVTEGTALANGHLGEQIKVRNDRSNRVVDGLVMGPGEVQVASW